MARDILIHAPGFPEGALFNPDARDGCLEPFILLRRRLSALGYELNTSDDRPVEGCEWLLFWDTPESLWPGRRAGLRVRLRALRQRLSNQRHRGERDLFAEGLRTGLADRMAVFLSEPEAVMPANWDPAISERFHTRLTWHDDYVRTGRALKYHEPIPTVFPDVEDPPPGKRTLLVNISGNKYSSHPRELYTARRQAIRYFERHQPDQFDLYGGGWDRPGNGDAPYRCYRGTVRHKWSVYPRYRFGLCYENMRDEPGLISEKIFDCMRAKCVPIYWGASNIEDYVDPEAFIDRRRFSTDQELEAFLVTITEREFKCYREAIDDYLRTKAFASFLAPAFVDAVVGGLRLA
jgi:hypothetical protein